MGITDLVKRRFPEDIPVIFAGDCNTNPSTEAFPYLNEGFKASRMQSAYPIEEHVPQEQINDAGGNLVEHGLGKYKAGAPKYRKGGNQKEKIKKVDQTIDYIYQRGFTVTQTLSIPTLAEVINDTNGMRLPSWKMPSDHFPIGATFEFNGMADMARRVVGLRN